MKSGEALQNALTGTLVLCAVTITVLLARRELFPPKPASAAQEVVNVRNWREYVNGTNRSGPSSAPVTLVEFSDLECPFCRVLAFRLDSLRGEFPRELQIVFRHYPLPRHRHAMPAALATECAGEQGRFWPMQDVLFRNPEELGVVPWSTYAARAGVADPASFERCMAREDLSRVQEDIAAGQRLGINGTPTILINERKLGGAPPLDSLRAYVRDALARPGRSNHVETPRQP
jgi:protein-disulfide isomerase